jgi:DNA modification methylase
VHKEVIGNATLYLGDCAEILPTLPSACAVITDPPYGLDERWTGGTWGANPMYDDARRWDKAVSQALLNTAISKAPIAIVWGANHYSMPPSRCWLSWRKSSKLDTMADFELAWTNLDRPAKEIVEARNPAGNLSREHPTQKPISVMTWCLTFVPDAGLILDPFMGSGTTGVACMLAGRPFTGIEIETKYFMLACERLTNVQRQERLFA